MCYKRTAKLELSANTKGFLWLFSLCLNCPVKCASQTPVFLVYEAIIRGKLLSIY